MSDTTDINLARWLPADDPRAIEINEVARTLGSMASHSGNLRSFEELLAKGQQEALTALLDRLQESIDNQRAHPFAFDYRLILSSAFQLCILLKHADAGSSEWLRSYGVEVNDHE